MISKQEVEHIAKLARLELSHHKELEKMQKALSMILEYVEMLNKVDVSGVESSSRSIAVENVMRKDIVEEQNPDSLKKQFPAKEGDHLKVKGVL